MADGMGDGLCIFPLLGTIFYLFFLQASLTCGRYALLRALTRFADVTFERYIS
jgi:hypothetical protein